MRKKLEWHGVAMCDNLCVWMQVVEWLERQYENGHDVLRHSGMEKGGTGGTG